MNCPRCDKSLGELGRDVGRVPYCVACQREREGQQARDRIRDSVIERAAGEAGREQRKGE